MVPERMYSDHSKYIQFHEPFQPAFHEKGVGNKSGQKLIPHLSRNVLRPVFFSDALITLLIKIKIFIV